MCYKLILASIIYCFAIPKFVSAQQAEPRKSEFQTAINAMLAYIHVSNFRERPYIVRLHTAYDDKGLSCEQTFASDPTLKKVDRFKVWVRDGGFISGIYNGHQYDFWAAGKIVGMDYKSGPATMTVRIDSDAKGQVVALTWVERRDRNNKIDQRFELIYDNDGRIVRTRDFKVDLLNEACPPALRSERTTHYLDDGGVKMIKTNYLGGQGADVGKVRSVAVGVITKTDDYSYRYVSGDVEQRYRYNDDGRVVYESYRQGNGNGWEKLTEYTGNVKTKEDYRSFNAKVYERVVTCFLEEGDLKQFYNEHGEAYKEEQNFKSREKMNGAWTDWKY